MMAELSAQPMWRSGESRCDVTLCKLEFADQVGAEVLVQNGSTRLKRGNRINHGR